MSCNICNNNKWKFNQRALIGGRGHAVADALAGGGKDDEDHAGQDASAERKVEEQLPGVAAGIREEALLDGDITERNSEEDKNSEGSMDVVNEADAVFLQVGEYGRAVIAVPLVIEDKEALESGDAVVDLAVSAHKAVCECEEHAWQHAEGEQEHREVLVWHVALALVCEGRRQGLYMIHHLCVFRSEN